MNAPAYHLKTWIIRILAVGMTVFHLYTAGFGSLESMLQRTVHLAFALSLIFLLHSGPAIFRKPFNRFIDKILSACLLLGGLIPLAYIFFYQHELTQRFQFVTPLTLMQIIFGFALAIVTLEACRRLTGWVLPFIILLFMIYPFISDLPGVLKHNGYSLSNVMDATYLTTFGIFGIPLGASANYIALFIMFGAFLEKSGVGKFAIDIANAIAGRFRGGPAKVAIIASGMLGSISGSAPSNVLTVGTITIPLMKRVGYPAHQAGAIEAAASTAGPILPPIMGSVVFLMAQYTNVPYSQLMWIALPAALLYLFGVFLAVHWNALKYDIRGLERHEIPSFQKVFRDGFHLLLPIVIMIILLTMGKSPQFAVFYSIVSVVIVSYFRKGTRMGIRDIIKAMENGAKGSLMVAIATAAVGMIVGVFELTGLALRISQVAVSSIDSLIVGLLLTMIVSILLGMAVPPSASYIVQVGTTIPMIVAFLSTMPDLPKQSAIIISHFFVLYFSVMAVLTPPDALASIAAAGIAGSPFIKTALTATRIAFVGFTVPFMSIYRPGILLQGNTMQIVQDLITALVGVFAISIALEGYFLRPMSTVQRGIALVSGILIIFPGVITDVMSITLMILVILWQLKDKHRSVNRIGKNINENINVR